MIVRREQAADAATVRALVGETTATMYNQVRAVGAWLPGLCFVALGQDGRPVGYVAATRGTLGPTPALGLAPPLVHPEHRSRGVGQALMHTVLGAADAVGEPVAGVVGDPADYFTRFGFRSAAEFGIDPPKVEWQPFFLVRPLTRYTPTMRGTFSHPARFTSG